MLLPCGRWNSHWVNYIVLIGRCYSHVADVIAMWQMLLPLGGLLQFLVSGCSTEPDPIYVADGICLCFYSGMIVHPYINCFFYSSDEVLILPPHNTEIFNAGFMTCDVIMVINWGGGIEVFLIPLSKGS